MVQKYRDLGIKDKVAICSCIAAFILGWLLTIAGFIVSPLGEVSDSVLWILGQSLLYCASVLGIGMYASNQVKEGFRKVRRDLKIKENNEDEV